MSLTECVIDATLGVRDGRFCFCPVEGDFRGGDFSLVTGMNLLSDEPPKGMRLVGIVHEDGQDAVDAFCEKYANQLAALQMRLQRAD